MQLILLKSTYFRLTKHPTLISRPSPSWYYSLSTHVLFSNSKFCFASCSQSSDSSTRYYTSDPASLQFDTIVTLSCSCHRLVTLSLLGDLDDWYYSSLIVWFRQSLLRIWLKIREASTKWLFQVGSKLCFRVLFSEPELPS